MSDYMLGILITAGIVLAYTMIGGFLAVSLTDFVCRGDHDGRAGADAAVVCSGRRRAGGSLSDVPVEDFSI